ncbi:Cytochrome c, partial [Durusdinium trenchii]
MLGIQGRFTRRFCHIVVAGLFVTAIGSFDRDGRADDSLGVQVPDGFEVSLYAGDDLAHDIYSMTVDSQGRVVVSGAGYVRILIDADGDGRAESYQEFVDGPRTGAQGMYHLGSDLLCSGDAGLLRYRDRNRDDRADGPPDVFLKIHAGNEHDLHAIRKGPDGWWYVIAGNMAGVTSDYINLPASPVKSPQAGTVMRFTPDLSRGEVIADGLRNAYDFDFSSAGDLFTFDSDGERDMSLPWYRPTRVFHVLPGMSHGWFSRSWKRPDNFFDMPPAVAEFGRGSPTGVCCYRHDQFPAEYQGALFVLDWTYGRVWALPLEKSGSSWSTQPIDFMQAVGQHGFAPTDAVVGPDGSLFVCVGGRGTQGAVYRIRSKTPPPQRVAVAMRHDASPKDQLDFCLRMPQPLSSWARQRWEPIAHNLKAEPFIRAALDASRPAHERVRAIEILTEKFGGLDSEMVARLRTDEHPQIRARTIWALGRSNPDGPDASQLAKAFEDSDPHVVRTAVETLVGAESAVLDAYAKSLPEALGHSDRYIRALSGTVLGGMSPDAFQQTVPPAIQKGWAAAVPVAIAYARLNEGKYVNYPVEVGLRILRGKHGQARKLEAARVIEVALGDVGPDGPEHDLSAYERELDALRIALAEIYPTGDAVVDLELLRVIAMAQPANDQLVDAIAGQLTDESDPILDIHRLITLARLPVIPSPTARGSIAAALVNLDAKIESRGLIQDSNWDDRVLEMYSALVQRDPQLAIAILEHPKFGEPAHIAFLGDFPPERFEDVLGTFLRRIREENDYEWTPDVIYLLAASGDPELMSKVREMFHDPSLRNAVLLSLSEMPEE